MFDEKSFYNPENKESDNEDSDNEVSEVISTKAQDLLDLHEIPQTTGGKNEVGERESIEENIVQQGGTSIEKEGKLPMDYGTIYPMPTLEPITLP
jgi:hypothetical protein